MGKMCGDSDDNDVIKVCSVDGEDVWWWQWWCDRDDGNEDDVLVSEDIMCGDDNVMMCSDGDV